MVLPFLAALAPLLGAGVSAVGSVMSANAAKEAASQPQVTRNEVDYAKMVRDAEAAGFNPLTVLRNGGSAGYATTIQHPVLSSISPIGEGLQAIGNGISAWQYDPLAERRRDVELKLAEAQLANINADTRRISRSFDVPTYGGTGVRSSAGGFGGKRAPTNDRALQLGPFTWEGSPSTSPMQKVEDEYGDYGALPYLVFKLPADIRHNVDRARNYVSDQFSRTEAAKVLKRIGTGLVPEWRPTPEKDLPNPMQFKPMSAW